MKNVLALIAVAGVAAAANAQLAAPVVTWQVSSDAGVTWGSAVIVTSPAPTQVRVRGVLSWTRPVGDISALAGVSFDGRVAGTIAETGATFNKPLTQGLGAQVGNFANLGGGVSRFSQTSDTGAAGSNANWWTIGQDANLWGTIFDDNGDPIGRSQTFAAQNTSNSVIFLSFRINIDYSANHVMTVDSVMDSRTNPSRAITLFTNVNNADGGGGESVAFSAAQTTVVGATITVLVPTPGSLALLGLGGLAAARRRR